MGRSGLRWLPLLALFGTVACTSTVAGTPTPGKVVGVQQRLVDDGLEVTVLAVLDPAPVADVRSFRPEEGERLVAARFKITNIGDRDKLVGPTGRVEFLGSDGKTYDDALTHTSAGIEFDQLHLSPGLTVVGYVAAELPERVTVASVQFKADFGEGPRLRWKVVNTLTEPPPAPAARPDSRTGAHKLGEQVTLAEERKRTGERISIAATKVIDPAPETPRVQPAPFMRLVGVEFAARNISDDVVYDDNEGDSDLRLFAVFNAADEAVRAHPFGVAPGGMPLQPGKEATWSVLFEVPSTFEVDRIAFTPLFGSTTTTLWAAD